MKSKFRGGRHKKNPCYAQFFENRTVLILGGVTNKGRVVFFLQRTCVLSGIHFTRHFIEFVVVETKHIVSSKSNVILTRQTCGQRSGMAAASKHRALAFCFSVRICYLFLISKCRGESDLGLCMTLVLAKRMPLRSADFQCLSVFCRKIRQNSALRFF